MKALILLSLAIGTAAFAEEVAYPSHQVLKLTRTARTFEVSLANTLVRKLATSCLHVGKAMVEREAMFAAAVEVQTYVKGLPLKGNGYLHDLAKLAGTLVPMQAKLEKVGEACQYKSEATETDLRALRALQLDIEKFRNELAAYVSMAVHVIGTTP